jgi:hypothetical protein
MQHDSMKAKMKMLFLMVGNCFLFLVLFYNRIKLTQAFRLYCTLIVGLSYHGCRAVVPRQPREKQFQAAATV